MPAWCVSAVVLGLLLCSTMVDAHAFMSFPSPRGQYANPKKRIDEEQAPTGTSPNDQAFICRGDPEMPKTNWASLTAGQSQSITITYDAPHIGDCFVYLTYDGDKATSEMKWFKIWERHQCNNSTRFDIPIPSYLPSGSHVIFRWEWYALHQYPISIEYYTQCVDATISGSASGKLPQPQVNIPGHLPSAASEYWDPYAYPEEPMRFTGPKVATLDGASTGTSTTAPTTKPTTAPTTKPTTAPTAAPTTRPTAAPTTKPTAAPTAAPTTKPTAAPTSAPTTKPTNKPTTAPTNAPTTKPTTAPTSAPTTAPTRPPTEACSPSNVYFYHTVDSSWQSGGKTYVQYNLEIHNTCSGKKLTGLTFSASNWNIQDFWDVSATTSSNVLTLPGYITIATANPYVVGYISANGQAAFTPVSATFQ